MPDSIHIFTDVQTRRLYANDASMYEELPEGVAFPGNTSEIRELVKKAYRERFSITPRAAGTSLAGQTTGNGVVMDISHHMIDILELNPEKQIARVQPGVIRDTLNREAGRYGLLFGPDTATTNRCMIGGMIGNNSCGSFSIKYGTTRDHVVEIETVLSDGSTVTFKPLNARELEQKKSLDTLEGHIYRGMIKLIGENREQILDAYPHPEIIRRNTGYALDRLCTMQPFKNDGRPFNLAELLCGSEGTLAITTSALLKLVPADPHHVVVVPHFDSLQSAMEATVKIVDQNPAAVELVDNVILNATKDNLEQRKNRFFLQGEPRCILVVQFDGQSREQLVGKAESLQERLTKNGSCYAAPVIHEPDKIDRVWELRKAGLGLLMGLGSDTRTPTFCEDTAVRVQDLPAYVEEFRGLLKKYDTDCVFYAHASVGELHLRPVIDLQKPEGIQKMKSMAEEVAKLVGQYRGSLSGEHGDGRARSPYIEKVLGPDMMTLLRKVKELWDPNYLLNPGKIVQPHKVDEDLRFSPSYRKASVKTQFNWRKEDCFGNALELCNGAGVCRKLEDSGGTMCPSYMATRNEKDTTRGRANLLRQIFSSRQESGYNSTEIKDALDLCISCKGCKSECPANVDMARMKAEFMQGWHDRNGAGLADHFFGKAASYYPLAASFPRLTNWFNRSAAGRELLKQVLNVHPDRTIPTFANETFLDWFNNRSRKNRSGRKVVFFVDIFSNYHEPEIPRAATLFLEQAGYEIKVPGCLESGRTQISRGFVREAKKLVHQNLRRLSGYVIQGYPLVGFEPSGILTLRDEYLDLCDDELYEQATLISQNTYQFEEFLVEYTPDFLSKAAPGKGQHVYVHGHCHAKALTGISPVKEMLRLAGYQPVDLETGCCGMAGSFGYEADHYDISMDIGELVLFPAVRELEEDAIICAPGFSCRHQVRDGTGRKALHPAQLLVPGNQ